MSGLAYPRDRIETCLIEAVLPLSYRIIPENYLTSPLGTAPADSRFCTKADGYTVLWTKPLRGIRDPSIGQCTFRS